MAKRQRRDSIQEHMIETMDERKKRISRPKKTVTTYSTISVADLREGDLIVTHVNERNGVVTGTEEVRELDPMARGCRNVHVNGKYCYDRCSTVRTAYRYSVDQDAVMLPDGSYGTVLELAHSLGF